MAPRFYIDTDLSAQKTLVLPEKAAHHAGRVLRMREGDSAVLFDGKGNEAEVIMHFSAAQTEAEIISVRKNPTESPLKSTLIQSLVSQEKLDAKRLQKRLIQWKGTVLSACEQCGRAVLPEILYYEDLQKALLDNKSDTNIVLAPAAAKGFSLNKTESITFAVGPEGGFSAEEIELATQLGYESRLLGPRVLRTETAGLAALAVAQCLSGDFR